MKHKNVAPTASAQGEPIARGNSTLSKGYSGVILMFLASALFSVMSIQVKALRNKLPFPEAVMLRGALGALLLAVVWIWQKKPFRPRRYGLLILRGLLGGAAMLGFFFALQNGILANIAILSRFQPILVAILSPIVIKEPVPRVAIVALGLSLIGIILVLQPSAAPGIDPASLAALGAATISAFAHLTVRRLNATDDPLMIVAVFSVVTSAMGGVVGAESHIFPGVSAWLLVVGIALTATGAQLLMTHAYGRERASVVAAAGYMHVVYALIFGWIFWREWPPTRALIGAAVIIGAGILLAVARSKIRELPRDRDKSAE